MTVCPLLSAPVHSHPCGTSRPPARRLAIKFSDEDHYDSRPWHGSRAGSGNSTECENDIRTVVSDAAPSTIFNQHSSEHSSEYAETARGEDEAPQVGRVKVFDKRMTTDASTCSSVV